MRRRALGSLAALVLAGCAATSPPATEPAADSEFERATAKLERREGLLTTWLDRRAGKLWLEVPAGSRTLGEYLYVEGLLTGLGSNPVGLDRGQLGGEKVVRLLVEGGRLLVLEVNLRFRATSDDVDERRAVEQSFAPSVIWAGKIESRDADGRGLVDLTTFLVRDAHGVSATLKTTGQGKYELDPERSAVMLDSCLSFPDNLEFEALLTFAGAEPGDHVRRTAPSPQEISFVLHQSLLRLPGPGYEPRSLDPRMGSFGIGFADYAAGLDEPIDRRWIVRHRLQKTDPTQASSPVEEPIVYYLDRGTPEPVRSALLDGAGWWAEAFTEAGFEDAFRVEMMPEGAHPLDARFNVIQWVHRSTRGWSYGGGVIDPRTGEMIKGHVTLGSLRVRQDRLLFEGLLGTAKTGSGDADDPIELALARIRQLSAHEVGHTLGLTHNFAASTYGRASVMDYPAPLITVGADGELDVSEAYGVGVGAWDRHAIRWAYSQFAPGVDEAAALEEIVREGLAGGLRFVADADARPPGAALAFGSLWDNGAEAVEALQSTMAVRRRALTDFGDDRIANGRPLAELQEVLAPVYFHHRYQLEATVKLVGGLDYAYAVRGDGQPGVRQVPAELQRAALATVLDALDPVELDLGEATLELLAPRPFGWGRNREMFTGATDPGFDALGAAATAADLVVGSLVQDERAARLLDQHRRDATLPGWSEVVAELLDAAFGGEDVDAPERLAAIERVVQHAAVRRLASQALSGSVAAGVRAITIEHLSRLGAELEKGSTDDLAAAAHRRSLLREINAAVNPLPPPAARARAASAPPPGSPIGQGRAAGFADCSFFGGRSR